MDIMNDKSSLIGDGVGRLFVGEEGGGCFVKDYGEQFHHQHSFDDNPTSTTNPSEFSDVTWTH